MKIFITGQNGFLGSALCRKLESLGHDVCFNFRFLRTEKYDLLFHLAAKNNIANKFDPDLIESNIILTKKVFSVNTKIVFMSSCVAKFPLNPYAYSKLYSEHLGKIHGNAIGIRLHNCYGPRNNKGIVWYLMNQKDGAKIVVRGDQLVRDYILVDDVVNALCKADTWIPGVYDVGTGVGTETMDLVNLYQRLSGKKFDISIEEAGDNEPKSMISNNIVPHMKLEDGLLKMIKDV